MLLVAGQGAAFVRLLLQRLELEQRFRVASLASGARLRPLQSKAGSGPNTPCFDKWLTSRAAGVPAAGAPSPGQQRRRMIHSWANCNVQTGGCRNNRREGVTAQALTAALSDPKLTAADLRAIIAPSKRLIRLPSGKEVLPPRAGRGMQRERHSSHAREDGEARRCC